MRKLTVIFLVSMALLTFQSTVSATSSAVCAMFMCSYGDGNKSNNDGVCSEYMKVLKDIVKANDCSKTKAERLARLMLCEEAPKDQVIQAVKIVGCLTN
jgi:hypothetical protein